jgi:hypothetical protein
LSLLPDKRRRRRAEALLWTGPVGHFVGGSLDFLAALARYARTRWRRRLMGGPPGRVGGPGRARDDRIRRGVTR